MAMTRGANFTSVEVPTPARILTKIINLKFEYENKSKRKNWVQVEGDELHRIWQQISALPYRSVGVEVVAENFL